MACHGLGASSGDDGIFGFVPFQVFDTIPVRQRYESSGVLLRCFGDSNGLFKAGFGGERMVWQRAFAMAKLAKYAAIAHALPDFGNL